MKVLATYSIKGGVGKTTSAVNLAFEASRGGARVLVWDLDPQAAATYFLRVRPKLKGGARRLTGSKGELEPHIRASEVRGLDVVPADFSLRHLDLYLDDAKKPARRVAALLKPLGEDYDVVFLDCPPGITLSSESVFVASDALLVPVIPTPLSERTLRQLADFLAGETRAPALLGHFTMVDRRRRLQRELLESLAAQWPGFLTTQIPSASVVERMGVERAAVGAFAPRAPAAVAFRALWQEISARFWGVSRA